jgi:hypothetical protein
MLQYTLVMSANVDTDCLVFGPDLQNGQNARICLSLMVRVKLANLFAAVLAATRKCAQASTSGLIESMACEENLVLNVQKGR